ncbi:Fe-S oxidoreductase [Desulfocapsa sulfexigens DSM 10523]|uniref:Fe-S oxidoreductase n=1 Tax=Desulfocapsa sulfexigens (strain DSM 10523 / SB164P1) TaxID=1167006 RepID=M1PFV4_DESSD|nr:radical SAM protein [Desulfocapsa sulfexigens]AGF78555.1 Fe-S oxidoreductase [Desulfocapsa sulfexigens DSM 10523]
MKILLIYPRFKYPSGQPPLGLGSIISFLKMKLPDLSIDVYDATFETENNKNISSYDFSQYTLIGFSVMTTMAGDAHEMAALIKSKDQSAKIIFGGPHPTVLPELCMSDPHVDMVIQGEGEEAFYELLINLDSPAKVANLIYRENGQIISNERRSTYTDIDSLPAPDRSHFNMSEYIKIWNSMDTVSPNLTGTSLIISRGCPYNCSFCQPTLTNLFGKKIRKRAPENIIEELHLLKKRYSINAFMFEDDTFMIDKVWAERICSLLIESEMNFRWCCNLRADNIDAALLEKMYAAGLRKINIGMESSSDRLLGTVYNKKISTKQIIEAVNIAKKLKLKVQGYFILGHPSETLDDLQETIRFACKLPIDDVSFSILTPFPGTHLYASEKKLLSGQFTDFDYYRACNYSPEHMNVLPRKIEQLKSQAYLKFYTRPQRLLQQVSILLHKNGLKKIFTKIKRI